ncbi:putative Zinc finger C x8 C x5 C x3 H type (and similar) [Trypanosoma vivax]|uniref:C3H1-type domain-containing protein n=1 Tax=Trypanosoma vivax (strain Y486) TaxID=1055687 RepID=G0TVD2_TRYVY|nr:hypothetical protein TRVL_01085 [Trypanosoma vivax]KAH8617616.1 putative Zinc finger C x8 C x5 C x3 H type (and similar) [Trypanosoma vivax]CCC47898.1 conserved hypothetical protein [Trypanosoma vivax Y486]
MTKNRKHDIVKTSKYKTSLCSFFVDQIGCPFGERCAFAHGEEELRSEEENLKHAEVVENTEHTEHAIESSKSSGVCSVKHDIRLGPSASNRDDEDNNVDVVSEACDVVTDGVQDGCVTEEKNVDIMFNKDNVVAGVSNAESSKPKGIKPPPRITKGRYPRQSRASRLKPGHYGGTFQPAAPQYIPFENNPFFDVVGVHGQFMHLPPGAVLVPYPGAAMPYVPMYGASVRASSETVFNGNAIRPDEAFGESLFTPSRAHDGGKAPVPVPFDFTVFDTSQNTYMSVSDCANSFPVSCARVGVEASGILESMSVPPGPSSLSPEDIWSDMTPKGSEPLIATLDKENDSCRIKETDQCQFGSFSTVGASEAHSYSQVNVDWQELRKLLEIGNDSTDETNQCVRRDDILEANDPLTYIGESHTQEEEENSSLLKVPAVGLVKTGVPSNDVSGKNVSNLSTATTERVVLLDAFKHGGLNSATSPCSKEENTNHSTEEAKPHDCDNSCGKKDKSNAVPPRCPNCRIYMRQLLQKRGPIVVNQFHSSCAASGHRLFLYCPELQVVASDACSKNVKDA